MRSREEEEEIAFSCDYCGELVARGETYYDWGPGRLCMGCMNGLPIERLMQLGGVQAQIAG